MRLLKLFPLLVLLVLTACGKQEIETNMSSAVKPS